MPRKQFVITTEDWDPDLIARLEHATGGSATVRVVASNQIVVVEDGTWLSEQDFDDWLSSDPPEGWATAIFDALMAFNAAARSFRVDVGPELQELIDNERRSASLPLDAPLITMKLRVDSHNRLVAAHSLVELNHSIAAIVCLERLGLSVPLIELVRQWAAHLASHVPA